MKRSSRAKHFSDEDARISITTHKPPQEENPGLPANAAACSLTGASCERGAIWNFLEDRDPYAALRMDHLFSDAAAGLADLPMIGHKGEVPGTRELTPHRSYRLVYEVVRDTVTGIAAPPGNAANDGMKEIVKSPSSLRSRSSAPCLSSQVRSYDLRSTRGRSTWV